MRNNIGVILVKNRHFEILVEFKIRIKDLCNFQLWPVADPNNPADEGFSVGVPNNPVGAGFCGVPKSPPVVPAEEDPKRPAGTVEVAVEDPNKPGVGAGLDVTVSAFLPSPKPPNAPPFREFKIRLPIFATKFL